MPGAESSRRYLGDVIEKSGESFAELSRFLGRGDTYLLRHVRRGSPRRLSDWERKTLARYLGVEERHLLHDA